MSHPRNRPSRRARLLALALLGATAVSAASCSASFSGGGPATASPRGIALAVENGHDQDMRLYILRGGTRIPVGRVGSFSRRTFVVDAARLGATGGLVVAIDPVGSAPVHVLPSVLVRLGQRVEVRLAHDLRYSAIEVR